MAAGLGSFDGNADDRCSAQRRFLQATISACEKGLQWQQALGLLAQMQQTDVLICCLFLFVPLGVLESNDSDSSGSSETNEPESPADH